LELRFENAVFSRKLADYGETRSRYSAAMRTTLQPSAETEAVSRWFSEASDEGEHDSIPPSFVRDADSRPAASSFAGLLAALAEPAKKKPPARNEDGLADDVATLSYERALRTHARYKPVEPAEWPLAAESADKKDESPKKVSERVLARSAVPRARTTRADAGAATLGESQKDLRTASITIRVSEEECKQLRLRAAEAGLTLSAYLRSCTVEADALRAEVKSTLEQLRAGAASEKTEPEVAAVEETARNSGWLTRLLPHRKRRVNAA
jgi:hypothetical protein